MGPEKGELESLAPDARRGGFVSLFKDWPGVGRREKGVWHLVQNPICSCTSPPVSAWLPGASQCGHGNWKQI